MQIWDSILDRLLQFGGTVRNGRRTPETVYASFDDNLDDRTTNFPLFLVPEEPLARFVVEAVQEKLARARRPADPEAWLADQLAQLPVGAAMDSRRDACLEPGPNYGRWTTTLIAGSPTFTAIEKLAQEYGEMCAARALSEYEDLTIVTKDEGGLHVLVGGVEVRPLADVFPDGGVALREMGAGPLAVVHGLDEGEVVR
jgi:hypothetical protein